MRIDSLRPRCINKSHSTLQSGTTESSHDSRRSLKAFSSGSPETSSENEMSSPVFINKVITYLIIDDVTRMFQNWVEKESLKRDEEINFLFHNQSEELTNFLIEKFLSENTEDRLKLTFVMYVASEYFYSLLLCAIWNNTTKRI